MAQCKFELEGFTAFQAELDDVLLRMKHEQIPERIRRKDHTVWNTDPAEISNRLGWLDIAQRMKKEIPELNRFCETLKSEGYEKVLLLGMGGSSLAPELFSKTFGRPDRGLELRILDSTDPGMVLAAQDWADPEKTLFIVSSKSGGTAETFSFLKFFYTWMKSLKGQKAGKDFAVITDPGSSLEKLAKIHHFRKCFINDPDIGGRFSALSLFGLVPAALCGIDLERLLQSAENADWSLALKTGAIMGLLALRGRDKMTLVLSRELVSFGDWAEQLVAESTGKKGKGILPVLGEPAIPQRQTGNDRYFVHIKMESDRSVDEPLAGPAEAGVPILTLTLNDPYQLGEQFFIWELATAITGYLLDINPFDQPDVESAKVAARAMMTEYLKKGSLPPDEVSPWNEDTLKQFLKSARPGDYIALQAYIPMTTETEFRMVRLQTELEKYTNLAVTHGFGPRFLHSTGQLHKGDRGNGLFIQITCDPRRDAAIPNEPGKSASDMSFHILKTAQAMGDFQALKNQGRRAIHFHAEGELVKALDTLKHWIC